MDKLLFAAIAAACAVPTVASAETAEITTVAMVAPVKRITAPIAAGTPVSLKTVMPTTALKTGTTVSFELAEPIEVGGKVIVPAGATANAVISTVEHPSAGKPGRVTGRLQTLQYGDVRIRLIGGFEGLGSGMQEPIVPAGLAVRGFIDENVPVYVAPPVMVSQPVIAKIPTPIQTVALPAAVTRVVAVTPAPTPRAGTAVAIIDRVTPPAPKPRPVSKITRSKVTSKDVLVESGGTTTHYRF
jgi:hypothetical protein